MLKKFWPCLLALTVLFLYIAWIGMEINHAYDAPVAPRRGMPVQPDTTISNSEIDLGETTIDGDKK